MELRRQELAEDNAVKFRTWSVALWRTCNLVQEHDLSVHERSMVAWFLKPDFSVSPALRRVHRVGHFVRQKNTSVRDPSTVAWSQKPDLLSNQFTERLQGTRLCASTRAS